MLRRIAHLATLAWSALALIFGAALMAQHVVPLPRPDRGTAVAAQIALALGAGDRPLAAHVLYAGCDCSGRIVEHLLSRGARPGFDERLLFVGHDDALAARARRAGFGFEELTAASLRDRLHVEAAPLLLVVDGARHLRYAGGYTAQKRGPDPRDVEILEAVRRGEAPPPLPVFGCAVSPELQAAVDPLGLKY